MDKKEVIAFFDAHAPGWDESCHHREEIINTVLDGAEVTPGKTVLDVACGTGVLFPYYLSRQVESLTAIDIAPQMVRLAREKFPGVQVLCGDVETQPFSESFDCIVVYNAFPHFPDPESLIKTLSGFLKPGGTLTVAHGSSRQEIDSRHHRGAQKVSVGLMHQDDLARLMGKYLTVTVKISDDRMYQVTAKKE